MVKNKGIPQRFVILVVAALLSLVTASAVFAGGSATPAAADPSCSKEHAQSGQQTSPPPGQLVRRGITGKVVSVISDTPARITIETQFGKVVMEVPAGFDISTIKVGSRIAALLEKEPAPVIATPTTAQTDTPFRVGKAQKIKVIPSEASLTHQRAVVVGQQGDTLDVVDEDGKADTLKVKGKGHVQVTTDKDGKPHQEAEEEHISQGTDAILLVQCDGKDGKPQVHGVENAQRVSDRLEDIKSKAQEHSEAQAAKIAEIQKENAERQQERLDKTLSHVPPSVRDTVEKAHQQAQAHQCSGQGKSKDGDCPKPQETPKSKETPEAKENPRSQGTPRAKETPEAKETPRPQGTPRAKETPEAKETPRPQGTPTPQDKDKSQEQNRGKSEDKGNGKK